jgi:hypothetical protein
VSELEPLPDDLAALIAVERAAPTADAATRAASRARIAALGAPATKAAATALGLGLGGAGKTIAVLVLTFAAGAGTMALVQHATRAEAPASSATPAPAPERIELPAHEPPPESLASPAPEPPPESPPSPAPRAHERIKHADRTPPPPPSPSQPELLRRAWELLSTGDPAEALAIVRHDQQLHPDGVLAEERDAIAIHALAKLGRIDEARAAEAGFILQYPTSIHRARIERALEEAK